MKNKYLTLIALLLVTGMLYDLSSMGSAGDNVTGAPSEGNCTGCHGGTANSDANGSVSIKVLGDPVKYVPGTTYDVQVTTAYNGKGKFGFALAARMASKGTLGVGKLTGGTDMQVSDYITHTHSSNTGTNKRTWNFTWQAPLDATEPIVLYAAGLAANGDNSNIGDKVYTTSFTFQAPGSTGLNDAKLYSIYQLFPNPSQGQLHLEGNASEAGLAEIMVYDQKGQLVYNEMKEVNSGKYQLMIQLPTQLAMGVYNLVLKQGDMFSNKKFVLQ